MPHAAFAAGVRTIAAKVAIYTQPFETISVSGHDCGRTVRHDRPRALRRIRVEFFTLQDRSARPLHVAARCLLVASRAQSCLVLLVCGDGVLLPGVFHGSLPQKVTISRQGKHDATIVPPAGGNPSGAELSSSAEWIWQRKEGLALVRCFEPAGRNAPVKTAVSASL